MPSVKVQNSPNRTPLVAGGFEENIEEKGYDFFILSYSSSLEHAYLCQYLCEYILCKSIHRKMVILTCFLKLTEGSKVIHMYDTTHIRTLHQTIPKAILTLIRNNFGGNEIKMFLKTSQELKFIPWWKF